MRRRRPIVYRPAGADYELRVVGDQFRPLKDFYHALLLLSWPSTLGVIGLGFLISNALFAFGFVETGGIENARPDSFVDAFCFSVQTMGTVGYGFMYPKTPAANFLVVFEVIIGITLTALATGLIFAKFSRANARMVFTRYAVITLYNNVPTLMFRLGNERGNSIVDAHFYVTISRTERNMEGEQFYRLYDLKLVRDHALSLRRSFSVMHVIDETSPFHGQTPESIATQEIEIQVTVIGLDDTSMQTVHATHLYFAYDFAWGARMVDVLTEQADGSLLLDLAKFHEIEASVPSATFPYPRESGPVITLSAAPANGSSSK